MSTKPIVTQATVIDQIKGLKEQQYALEAQLEQTEKRMKLLQASLAENHVLEARVKELATESLALFQDEWLRRREYFPDIWLASVEQALIVAQPPKKK